MNESKKMYVFGLEATALKEEGMSSILYIGIIKDLSK